MTRLAQTLGLTEFQTEIVTTVRQFVDKEVIPTAQELEHSDTYPQAIVDAMKEMGLPASYVLGAASWRARAWLGWNPGLDEGDPADFVVYPSDPVDDLTVLARPSYVVLRGRSFS